MISFNRRRRGVVYALIIKITYFGVEDDRVWQGSYVYDRRVVGSVLSRTAPVDRWTPLPRAANLNNYLNDPCCTYKCINTYYTDYSRMVCMYTRSM